MAIETVATEPVEYTREDAAAMLGVSVRHVRRLVVDGVLVRTETANGAVRITGESVRRAVQARPPRRVARAEAAA